MERARPKYVPQAIGHTERARTPVPRAPAFFRDVAHTRPTRWGLYRGLLRALGGAAALAARPANDDGPSRIPPSRVLRGSSWLGAFQGTEPGSPATRTKPAVEAGFAPLPPLGGRYPHLLSSLRARWRTARGWTSMSDTRAFLRREEGLLGDLRRNAAVLSERETAVRTSFEAWDSLAPPKPVKPLLTGGFLRPTLFSPPLPRMKPQPHHITMMITRRVQRRERRVGRARWAKDRQADMRAEVAFWRALGIDTPDAGAWMSGPGDMSWDPPLQAMLDALDESFAADKRRAHAMFPPDMIQRVKEARRRREAWRVRRARRRREEAADDEDKHADAGGNAASPAPCVARGHPPAPTMADTKVGSSPATPDTPRSRGRPRKDPAASQVAPTPVPGAKPRGRPRKATPSTEREESADATHATPKRRGRPPKATSDAVPPRRGRPPKTKDE